MSLELNQITQKGYFSLDFTLFNIKSLSAGVQKEYNRTYSQA